MIRLAFFHPMLRHYREPLVTHLLANYQSRIVFTKPFKNIKQQKSIDEMLDRHRSKRNCFLFRSNLSSLEFWFCVIRIVRSSDLVIATNALSIPCLFVGFLAYLAKKPFVVYDLHPAYPNPSKIKLVLFRFVFASVISRANSVISASDYHRGFLLDFVPYLRPHKVFVAPTCSQFPSLKIAKKLGDRREGNKYLSVVIVSRLIAFKGVVEFLRHLQLDPKYLRALADVSLDIYGDGPLANKIVLEVSKLVSLGVKVKWHGELEPNEVQQILSEADVNLSCSLFDAESNVHFEGWGLVLNESALTKTLPLMPDGCGATYAVLAHIAPQLIYETGSFGQVIAILEKLSRMPRQELTQLTHSVSDKISNYCNYTSQVLGFDLAIQYAITHAEIK